MQWLGQVKLITRLEGLIRNPDAACGVLIFSNFCENM